MSCKASARADGSPGWHNRPVSPSDTISGPPDTVVVTTGNPFAMGVLKPGDNVVDVGCGAGIDSLIAAKMVGPDGHVVGIDMTPEMLARARDAANEAGVTNVEFLEGYMEELPIPDGWADVVISNGVINLCPDKARVYGEIHRVLRPGGRMQIADIMVAKPVSQEAKHNIDLWTG